MSKDIDMLVVLIMVGYAYILGICIGAFVIR